MRGGASPPGDARLPAVRVVRESENLLVIELGLKAVPLLFKPRVHELRAVEFADPRMYPLAIELAGVENAVARVEAVDRVRPLAAHQHGGAVLDRKRE